jgi:FkbM family methyltransferase
LKKSALIKYVIPRPSKWIPALRILLGAFFRHDIMFFNSDGISLECGAGKGRGVWCALSGLDYEPELLHFLRNLELGNVVFDIGANIGTYAIRSAVTVGHEGHVYAFEPLRQNEEMLRNSILRNNITNITVIKKAVGEETGEILISTGGRCSSASILHKVDESSQKVSITSIDDFVRDSQIPKLDWVKMDIEGAEPSALRGMLQTIKKFRPCFLFENHEGGPDSCRILQSLDYSIGCFNANGQFVESKLGSNLFAFPKTRKP